MAPEQQKHRSPLKVEWPPSLVEPSQLLWALGNGNAAASSATAPHSQLNQDCCSSGPALSGLFGK